MMYKCIKCGQPAERTKILPNLPCSPAYAVCEKHKSYKIRKIQEPRFKGSISMGDARRAVRGVKK